MVSVFDVADYILENAGPMTAMKLQKLVYYCQAWSLVWDEEPLFRESIEAWANGPVVPDLYRAHRGEFELSSINGGDRSKLDAKQVDTIQAVINAYGDKTSQWLSDLTHIEDPWKNAREGIPAGTRSQVEISHASMIEYYSSF